MLPSIHCCGGHVRVKARPASIASLGSRWTLPLTLPPNVVQGMPVVSFLHWGGRDAAV